MDKVNHPYVFQTDSVEIKQLFTDSENFLIEGSESTEKNGYCAVYFCSNDIYYPNTSKAFNQQLVDKNRFEWYGTRVNYACKHIFLRDIKKQWYLNGVSGNLNSIEKVASFLKKETEGYKVVTIGSSAGGYAAVLFGQLIGAVKTYSFNGQFMLHDLLESSSEKINPTIFRNSNNSVISNYFSLKPYITNPNIIYYFYSLYSEWDVNQYLHVKELNINYVAFKTKHHGIPFPKVALSKIINVSQDTEFKRYNNSVIFAAERVGYFRTIRFIGIELLKYFKMRIFNFNGLSK